MAIRHDTADYSGNAKETWFLKTGEDAVCGELEIETLAQWAETGRILAEHEVSRNGETWVKAHTVPDLKMDWYATLKSGATHGPVNLLALPELYRRGVINATAVLRNKLTNREIPAVALLRGMRDPTTAPKRRPPLRRIVPRQAAPPEPAEAETLVTPGSASPLPGVRVKGAAPPTMAATTEKAAIATAPPVAPSEPPPHPDIKRLEGKAERLQKELREHKDRMAELLKQLADETALHEQLRARHTRTVRDTQKTLEEKQQLIAAGEKATAELKARIGALDADNRRLAEARTTEIEKERQDRSVLEKDLREAREAQSNTQREAANKEAALSAQINGLEKEAHQLRQEVGTLNQALEEARWEAARIRDESAKLAEHVTEPGPVDKASDAAWYLRLDDQRLYGPVTEGELYAWAADCRIGPGQQVSRDRKTWQAVESLSDLRMKWHVKLVDGTRYGPLNAFAIPHLIKEGAAQLGEPLLNDVDGSETPLEDILVAEAAAVKERAAERIREWRQRQTAPASLSPPRTIHKQRRKNGS